MSFEEGLRVMTHPTYDEIHGACVHLVHQMLGDEKFGTEIPDTIIALSRGGLIPGVILSHELIALNKTVVVYPLAYSSNHGNGDNRNHQNRLPELDSNNILIVDDICDSGHTMKEVQEFYSARPRGRRVVRTATLYYKESAVHLPTYFVTQIPADSPWIVFPWETPKYLDYY